MDIKPYGHQLAQSASQNRALATLSDSDDKQSGWSQQVSLSSQVLTGKAQQALTYEHLARNGKNTVLTGGVKDARVQQMVDKALGFDRKKFDDLERQLKGIADDKTLSAEERETQSKDLAAQRDAMLKEAMDRREPVEESTKVSLGQQGPSGSVAPSRSPTQMYASVAGMM